MCVYYPILTELIYIVMTNARKNDNRKLLFLF